MGTRDRVLELFEKERGVFLSGEQIAESLSVSRAAVWKSVKGLQAAGYPIEAATGAIAFPKRRISCLFRESGNIWIPYAKD